MDQIFEDVPDENLAQVEGGCLSAGATKVVKEKQENGLWKVTCTYPEEPATSQE